MDYLHILQQNLEALPWLKSELTLLATLLLVIVADLIWMHWRHKEKLVYGLALIGLLAAAGFLAEQEQLLAGKEIILFSNYLKVGGEGSTFFRLLAVGGLVLAILFRWTSEPVRDKSEQGHNGETEYLILLIGMLLGLQFLVLSSHLLITFLSIELISLCGYLLTLFRFNRQSAGASLKYLLFGAASAGFFAYGISWMYGVWGSLSYEGFQQTSTFSEGLASLAILLTITGFLFKISAFPLHFWVPDTYQYAPGSFVGFLSTVPKVIGVFALFQFLKSVNPEGFLHPHFLLMVVGISAAGSLLLGNLAALKQNSLKRMLAYSSIAHAGFLLLAFSFVEGADFSVLKYYGLAYLLLNMAAFQLSEVILLKTGTDDVADFSGLGKNRLAWGIGVLVIMLGLTGLPPTGGFTAKLLVFTETWQAYQQTGFSFLLFLLVFGVLNAAVSLFYYLKVPYFLFFKEESAGLNLKKREVIFVLILSISALTIFFLPGLIL